MASPRRMRSHRSGGVSSVITAIELASAAVIGSSGPVGRSVPDGPRSVRRAKGLPAAPLPGATLSSGTAVTVGEGRPAQPARPATSAINAIVSRRVI